MEALVAPRGLIVDLITPLQENGAIDGRGLGRLLDRMVPHAQGVLLASPQTGEGKNLRPDQRLELMEKALVAIRGRIPLLVWVSAETTEETRHTILTLQASIRRRHDSSPVFWVDTPLYYHSNRGLPGHYEALCEQIHEPLILHNDPRFIAGLARPTKRKNIRTAILKALSSIPGIAGLIFCGSLDRSYHYQRACRRRPHFAIYDGEESHFLEHPSMSGAVSAGANLAPKAWQRITQSSLHLTGDKKVYPDYLHQVWELGQYLRGLRAIYQPSPVLTIKGVLSDMAVIETPNATLPDEDIGEAKRRLTELISQMRI